MLWDACSHVVGFYIMTRPLGVFVVFIRSGNKAELLLHSRVCLSAPRTLQLATMDENRVTAHGKVPVFIGDDFELLSEQLECYFDANSVVEEGKKKSILLASLSPDNYRLLSDLVAPDKPRDAGLSFSDIVQKMKAHTAPEKSSQLARYEFDHLARSPGSASRISSRG